MDSMVAQAVVFDLRGSCNRLNDMGLWYSGRMLAVAIDALLLLHESAAKTTRRAAYEHAQDVLIEYVRATERLPAGNGAAAVRANLKQCKLLLQQLGKGL